MRLKKDIELIMKNIGLIGIKSMSFWPFFNPKQIIMCCLLAMLFILLFNNKKTFDKGQPMTQYVWLGCYDKVPKGEGYLYVHMSMGCTWMINFKFQSFAPLKFK